MCGEIGIENNGKVISFAKGTTMTFKHKGLDVSCKWVDFARAETFTEKWAKKIVSLHKLPISFFSEKGKRFPVKDRCVVFARFKDNKLRLLTTGAGTMRKVINHDRRPLLIHPSKKVPAP
jgi:hypothetical protein